MYKGIFYAISRIYTSSISNILENSDCHKNSQLLLTISSRILFNFNSIVLNAQNWSGTHS